MVCRLFVVAGGLLSNCDVGSIVAAWALEPNRLSYPAACGILVPPPGMEPASPALEGAFLTTGPPGKSLMLFL